MRIMMTGSPGTGKSEIAEKLSTRLGLELIDIKRIVRQRRLLGKNHEVDLKRLARALAFLKNKKDFIVEGHLACEIKLPSDFIFVLRTHPDVLKRRLAKRKYGKKKLSENLMAEMLDYCTQRVEHMYKRKPLELDTSHKSLDECAKTIAKAIKQKKKKLDSVDYSGLILRYSKAGK